MIIDGFGGPGGWEVAAAELGLAPVVGIELDAAACATRAAAGLTTIRADMTAFDVSRLAGNVTGQIHSPECTMFSQAGTRAGVGVLEELGALIRDMFAQRPTRAVHRRNMARALRAADWPPPKTRPSKYNKKHKTPARLTREQRSAAIRRAVLSASLVAEPARFIAACDPEWVALEQVPDVLPLWQVYAAELRNRGYSVWVGKLNAADYGVPQTRERAILIASRVRRVARPEPTHYDPRKGMQLWGTPWVSMSNALGWGATERPVPTVTAGGTATGGAEPFGHRDRDALAAERDAGQWVVRTSFGQPSDADRNGNHEMDPAGRPSHAVTTKARSWALRMDTQTKATLPRTASEPAPTMHFGHRSNLVTWVHERPATTVQGAPLAGRPGHKNRDKGEAQFEQDSVRITVEEAAALQSFPADYPWQGTKTARFRQVGDAFPPGLARHVLAEASGVKVKVTEAAA